MILGLPRFCIVGILCLDACCLDRLKLVRFDSSAQIVKPGRVLHTQYPIPHSPLRSDFCPKVATKLVHNGRVDEALRLYIRVVLLILASDTVFNIESAMLSVAKGPSSLLW